MPDTTTPTPVVPARPPFTGNETIESIRLYVAKTLNGLAGRLPDGRDRFTPAMGGVKYVESGLMLRIEVRRAGRGSYGPVDGVSPYQITVSEDALNPHGASGARQNAIKVKLHANGEAPWSKLHVAAVLHAQRAVEARERVRLAAGRRVERWTQLAAYMAEVEAAGAFPAPTKRGNLDHDGSLYDRVWRWNLAVRSGADDAVRYPDVSLYAEVEINISRERAEDETPFDPARHPADLSIGFGRYESGSRTMPLAEAFAFVRGLLTMRDYVAREIPGGNVTPGNRPVCPQCGSANVACAAPGTFTGAGSAEANRLCEACEHVWVDAAAAEAAANG